MPSFDFGVGLVIFLLHILCFLCTFFSLSSTLHLHHLSFLLHPPHALFISLHHDILSPRSLSSLHIFSL
ncbi:hypothetical protein P167DRAFT_533717 [Morchella conica CCBAS932]|uniref:Uncharacterized protein n=1 Tax=Morchella conica CCBAS932 TaxID=1392247 RepID=A0A3N4KZ96_9PEZI|nr:hypothetical protein P167DRAFT_533717 [Morchella conica CCBAS932]